MGFETRIHSLLKELAQAGRLRSLGISLPHSFIHNDYLGLADHTGVREAGRRALLDLPAGSTGSRLLGGNTRFFEQAEESIASHFGAPSALFFSSGYLANLGAVRAMAELCDLVVSDEFNHASLIDAISLSRKPKCIVPHHGWQSVSEADRGKRLLLVSEVLFSMDGDFVDESFFELASRTDSFCILDEAHSAGLYREDGRGWTSHRRDWERQAVTVTFGKAFGVAGAAVLCSTAVKDWLVNRARSFIYSTAPSPAVVAMVLASLELSQRESWRRTELWERAETVRNILRQAKPAMIVPERSEWERRSPIIPVRVAGDVKALKFAEIMRESGFEIRAIRSPTVPVGEERLRFSVSLSVDRKTTEMAAETLVKAWTEFSLPA